MIIYNTNTVNNPTLGEHSVPRPGSMVGRRCAAAAERDVPLSISPLSLPHDCTTGERGRTKATLSLSRVVSSVSAWWGCAAPPRTFVPVMPYESANTTGKLFGRKSTRQDTLHTLRLTTKPVHRGSSLQPSPSFRLFCLVAPPPPTLRLHTQLSEEPAILP